MHLTGTTPVSLMGQSLTPADITTKLQSIVTLRSGVNDAKAATKAKLAVEAAQLPALQAFMAALVSYVKGAYAGSPDVLADFGISPKARAPLSVEAKTAAVAKRAATRVARHTMGSQQKKAVVGNVTGVVVTPVTTPAPNPTTAPGPAPAPAPGVVAPAAGTPPHS